MIAANDTQSVWKVRRPSRTWQLRWWKDGALRCETTGTRDEAEAERARLRKEGQLGVYTREAMQPLELQDLLRRWLESRPVNAEGWYEREMRRLVSRFLEKVGTGGWLRTDRITPALVDRYAKLRMSEPSTAKSRCGNEYAIGKAPGLIRLHGDLRMLKALLNWGIYAIQPRALADNPVPLCATVRMRAMPRDHCAFTEEDLRRLLKKARSVERYAFLLVAWHTGARRGEIAQLRCRHFDCKACGVRIYKAKNKREVLLPLSADVLAIVRRLTDKRPGDDLVWPKDPLGSHGFQKLCRAANVQGHRFQDFRLTCSSRLVAHGLDERTAADYVGHSPEVARRHYRDLRPFMQELAKALDVQGLPPPPGDALGRLGPAVSVPDQVGRDEDDVE